MQGFRRQLVGLNLWIMAEIAKPLRLFVPILKSFSPEARAAALAARQAKSKGGQKDPNYRPSEDEIQLMAREAKDAKASESPKESSGSLKMQHEVASQLEDKAAKELKEAQATKDSQKIAAAETKWANALKLKVETGFRLEDMDMKKGHMPYDAADEGGDYNKFMQSNRARHR